MRILHFNYSRHYGGATTAAVRLFEAQRQSGRDVAFSAYSGGGDFPIPSRARMRVKWCRRLQKFVTLSIRGGRAYNLLRTGVGKWLNSLPGDIIHLHWMGNQVMGWPDFAEIEKPVVWTFHDTWPLISSLYYQGWMKTRPGGILESRFLAARKAVFELRGGSWSAVGPSSWMADIARQSCLFELHNVHQIPNCMEPQLTVSTTPDEAKKRFGLPLDARIFIAGASVKDDPRKGLGLLVEAWKGLGRMRSKLVLFGSRSPSDFNDPNILQLGELSGDELRILFVASDCMISPSLEENFSNLIVEAMLAGLPVIAFPVGGTPDLVVDGETGFLAADTSKQGLMKVLRKAMECPRMEDLGAKARIRTAKLVDPGTVVDAYDRIYKQMLATAE